MKNKIKERPGDIVEVPLPNGKFSYSQILVDGSYAFYDVLVQEQISDLRTIVKKPILFIAMVDLVALEEGRWKIVANLPLEDKLSNFYPRFFNPSPTTDTDINFYEIYKDEIEDAIKKDWIGAEKIQMGGIHGRLHIEKRIMDHYEGRRNEGNRNTIWTFKKCLNLPLDNV